MRGSSEEHNRAPVSDRLIDESVSHLLQVTQSFLNSRILWIALLSHNAKRHFFTSAPSRMPLRGTSPLPQLHRERTAPALRVILQAEIPENLEQSLLLVVLPGQR